MKKSPRSRKKYPKKSKKKYSKKSKKKSPVKKHRIIKLVEPIRHDVEKIVKSYGKSYGVVKTALVIAAVAALIGAGADYYNIKPITDMVVPYVDNNLPQIDIHGIINNTVQNFPEVNVDKFHNILSKVDSTDISSIASKNIKDSFKNVKSIENPPHYRYEGPYYENKYENIAENLYRGTNSYIRNEENFDKFFKTKQQVPPKPKKEYTLEEYIQSIRKFNDNNARNF